jgi:hypothetical protein
MQLHVLAAMTSTFFRNLLHAPFLTDSSCSYILFFHLLKTQTTCTDVTSATQFLLWGLVALASALMLAALVWRLLAARAAVNRYPDDADLYEEDVLPVRRTQKDPALLSQVDLLLHITDFYCYY